MDQAVPNQSSKFDLLKPDCDYPSLDLFRKLGYSTAEVRTAMINVGDRTDTDSVLGELIKNRARTPPCIFLDDSYKRGTGLPLSWTLKSKIKPKLGDKKTTDTELRPVVIDGSNVAMSHGNKEVFSCRGIQLAVNFFLDRGHKSITVFVPTWRKEQPRPDAPIIDQHILMELEKRKIIVFTPSRQVGGKRVVCYDDRFIVKLAHELDGVIVSNDTYRDLQGERPEWKKCIEERLLMYSFVNDKFMPPDDPLGRHGPSLDNFLRKMPRPTEQKRQLCPYDKKCTYGTKCKFYHPERANQSHLSLADELREKAQISTVKEERNAKSDPGPAHNAPSHIVDFNTELIGDHQNFSQSGQGSENKMLCCDNPGNSQNHMYYSATGGQCQKDWPEPHSMSSHYYANISHEYLDSGISSFESQYSDVSHCHSKSHRHRSQQQSAPTGPKHNSAHLRKKNSSLSCSCCSHAVPPTAHQQHYRNQDSKGYPPHMFLPSVPQQHSLPCHLDYSSVSYHQQNYQSAPFEGLPQGGSSCASLVHSSQSHKSCLCCESPKYHSSAQQQPSAFDQKRSELRKKLQAIFNPHLVDLVMTRFPHLTDAKTLAAEILNLKTGGVV